MKKVFLFAILWCGVFAASHAASFPSNTYAANDDRERGFLEKALSRKLDCEKEILESEKDFKEGAGSQTYDIHSWRAFGTQQCFRALLRAKDFETALRFIETSEKDYLDDWWSLALEDSIDIPVYATDGKCKSGDERYVGDAQERLMSALLMGRDLSEHPPGRRGDMEGVVTRLSIYDEYPACIDKSVVVAWLNKFIDLGLETKFWWEEPMVVGGLTTFSGVMRLDNIDLVERILSGGLNQNKKYVVYLYARAPSIDMVQALEKHFKLKPSECKAALKVVDSEKQFPERVRKYSAAMAPSEVVFYLKRCAQ